MKKLYTLLAALIITVAVLAQATPHEKAVVKDDIVKERAYRHAVAKDILQGKPEQAKAEHRAAVAYHKKAHRDIHQVQKNDAARAKRRHARRYR